MRVNYEEDKELSAFQEGLFYMHLLDWLVN